MNAKLAKLPCDMKVDEIKDLVIKSFNEKGIWRNAEKNATLASFKVGDIITYEKKTSFIGRFTVIINATGMYKNADVKASLCVTGSYKIPKHYKWVDGHMPVELGDIMLLKSADEDTPETEKIRKGFNWLLGMWDDAVSNRSWFDDNFINVPPHEEGEDPKLSDAEVEFEQTILKAKADVETAIQKFIDEKFVSTKRVLAL